MGIVRKTMGITIAGLGDPATGLPLRMNAAEFRTVSGVAIYTDLLAEWPSEVASEVQPTDGRTWQGEMAWTITHLDHARRYGDDARRFLMGSRPDAVALLNTTLAAGATSMIVEPLLGRDQPIVDDVIYLEREVITIDSITTDVPSAGLDTWGVTRARFDTADEEHRARDIDDREIFTSNHIVVGREVTAYEFNLDTEVETVKFRGLLDKPNVPDDLAAIELTARNSLAYAGEKKLGRRRIKFSGTAYLNSSRSQMAVASGDSIIVDVDRGPLLNGLNVTCASEDVILNIELALNEDGGTEEDSTYRVQGTTADGFTYTALMGSGANIDELPDTTGDGLANNEEQFREVLISDLTLEGNGNMRTHFGRDDGGGGITATADPFDILRNILTSTGTAGWTTGGVRSIGDNGEHDTLPAAWGMGIPVALIDNTAIDLLSASPAYDGLTMQNLVIGLEDELLDGLVVIEQICKAMFAFPVVTSTGQISFASILDPGPGQADAVFGESVIIPGSVTQTHSSFDPVQEITINVGRIWLTDGYSDEIGHTNLQQSTRKRYRHIAVDDEVDAGAVGPAGGWPEREEIEIIVDLFARRYRLTNDPLPEYMVSVTSDAPFVAAGQTVDISHAALIDNDGARGVSSHRCLVLSAARDSEFFDGTYRVLDLFPISKSDRVVAPSWRVIDVASATSFTVSDTAYTTDSQDREAWVDGRKYELWSAEGLRLSVDGSTTGTIVVGTGLVTLSAAWQDTAIDVVPVIGDIVQVPFYDDRGDWEDSALAWIADEDAELGAAQDDAHRWSQ